MAADSSYQYRDAAPTWASGYLWVALGKILEKETMGRKRIFEVGCGNGATASMLNQLGYEVIGVDPSESGIAIANQTYPGLQLYRGDIYDDLAAQYGRFPIVVSLEVIEHCYFPRKFASSLYDLLLPGGIAIISTPFHGYWKNLAISILGRWDFHFSPLWDHGHIKFFSEHTLLRLLEESGFERIRFIRAGRVAPFAKSMIAVANK